MTDRFFHRAHLVRRGLGDPRHNERTHIFACRTAGVDEAEYKAALQGVLKIIQETRRNLEIASYGNYRMQRPDYNSPEWYVQQAMLKKNRGFGFQAAAYRIDKRLRTEPFQKETPHYDIMVVDTDLTTFPDDKGNHFIFGLGGYPNNILSTARLQGMKKELRLKCLAVLAAHEFGHNLGLSSRSFNNGNGNYTRGHCNGEKGNCLMEQVNVPGCRDMEDQARLIFDRTRWLCEDCLEEIANIRGIFQQAGKRW